MTPEPDAERMTIRQMSETFEVTPRALRFHRANNLLRPIRVGTRPHCPRSDRARLRAEAKGLVPKAA